MAEDPFLQAGEAAPECRRCGTCCVAPDISTLGKGTGQRCPHLSDSFDCLIYQERPAVCRGYRPDGICLEIAAPTLGQRVDAYLGLFGVERLDEAFQGELAVQPLGVGELGDPVPEGDEEVPVFALDHRQVVMAGDDGIASGGEASPGEGREDEAVVPA